MPNATAAPGSAAPTEASIHAFLRRQLVDQFGGNVSKLARSCETSPSLASKWVSEDPRRRIVPSPNSCRKIAVALGIPADDVLAMAGYRDELSAVVQARQLDPDLEFIQAAWPSLPEGLKQAIKIIAKGGRTLTHLQMPAYATP